METIQRREEASEVNEEAREKHRGRRVRREGEVGQEEAELSIRLAYSCSPKTVKAEARQSLQVHSEPGLCIKSKASLDYLENFTKQNSCDCHSLFEGLFTSKSLRSPSL